jgi:3-hydroxyisobutyrate dehydrogenase-like beta-hydroxyacid dehydrogenase
VNATADGARIGFIGLGSMGAPMAKRLLEWPGGLTVCDTRAEAVAPFTDAGAESASSAAELAAKCAVISVVVVDDAQVRQVVTGPGGLLATAAPGTVVAVHSTISDSTAVELAARCAERGVELVDAPVSGGAPGANRGFGDLIVHAGPVGAGTRMKLARNLVHFVAFTAATEAQRLAEAAGLDITTLGKVVRHSDAVTGGPGAIMLRERTGPIAEGDFWLPIMGHVRDLGDKDLGLALDLGRRLGIDLPLAALAREHLGPGLGVPGAAALDERTDQDSR